MTLIFPLIQSNPLKIVNKGDYHKNKKNLIEIYANLLLYTTDKTQIRVLKKASKNINALKSFLERYNILKKKLKGTKEKIILKKKESSLQEEVNISLILLEAKIFKESLNITLGNLKKLNNFKIRSKLKIP